MPARPATAPCSAVVDRLVGEFDLRGVAAQACADAGTPEATERVSYCVAALVLKKSIDLDGAGFRAVLADSAAEVARNLRRWAEVYEKIQEEATQYETATLEKLIKVGTSDVIATSALRLGLIVDHGARLEEMSIDELCDDPPAANAYLFAGSLSAWANVATDRLVPKSLPPPLTPPVLPGIEQQLEHAHREGGEIVRVLVEAVARFAGTRTVLARMIEPIRQLERAVDELEPRDGNLHGLRAQLLHVADGIDRERRALTGMLAYVVLGLTPAQQMQRIAILYLRHEAIDRAAIDELASRMRSILDDDSHPTPSLVGKADKAAAIPRSRADDLRTLRDDRDMRAAARRVVVQRLDELPPIVADRTAIASEVEATPRVVSVQKSSVKGELTDVDPLYGQVFDRYATGER